MRQVWQDGRTFDDSMWGKLKDADTSWILKELSARHPYVCLGTLKWHASEEKILNWSIKHSYKKFGAIFYKNSEVTKGLKRMAGLRYLIVLFRQESNGFGSASMQRVYFGKYAMVLLRQVCYMTLQN